MAARRVSAGAVRRRDHGRDRETTFRNRHQADQAACTRSIHLHAKHRQGIHGMRMRGHDKRLRG
jgi:hypothetical protein